MHIEIKLNIYFRKEGKRSIFFQNQMQKNKKQKNQDPSIGSELNLET